MLGDLPSSGWLGKFFLTRFQVCPMHQPACVQPCSTKAEKENSTLHWAFTGRLCPPLCCTGESSQHPHDVGTLILRSWLRRYIQKGQGTQEGDFPKTLGNFKWACLPAGSLLLVAGLLPACLLGGPSGMAMQRDLGRNQRGTGGNHMTW